MTDSLSLSNSLADLSARIRVEHRATSAALKSSVEHAMAAGDLLLEAKALVPHGQWLPWLAEHCEMSERTAQLYMRTAKNREAVELQMRNTDADLTLNEAAALLFLTSDVKKLLAFTKQISETADPEQVVAVCVEHGVALIRDTGYDMWAGTNAEQKRDWTLYVVFLATSGWSVDGAGWTVEWLRQRPFVSVDEWLGPEGADFRRRCRMSLMPQSHIDGWREYASARINISLDEIEAELISLPEPVHAGKQRRNRRVRT